MPETALCAAAVAEPGADVAPKEASSKKGATQKKARPSARKAKSDPQ